MSVLLVTYDLKKPGQNYSEFYKVIKNYDWARLSESSYAINTYDSPDTVYAKLKPHMDSNDNVYIVTLVRPYSGFGPEEVNKWLEARLPSEILSRSY